jgi:peptidoglycan/LPS O-acetylase OafA/YrhL
LATVGVLSYSLYLWQELFLLQWRTPVSVLQTFPANVLAACACAVVSYQFVEKPFLRLKSRVESSRIPRRDPAPGVALPDAL